MEVGLVCYVKTVNDSNVTNVVTKLNKEAFETVAQINEELKNNWTQCIDGFVFYCRGMLLENFNILSSDTEARMIFPEPPLVSYRRERNLSSILVHSADASSSSTDAGSWHLYRTCKHVSSQTFLPCPRRRHNIVTTLPVSLRMPVVYFISCCCTAIVDTSERLEGDYGSVSASTSADRLHGFPARSWTFQLLRLPLSGWDHGLWLETVPWQCHQPQAVWNDINLQAGPASTKRIER